MKEASTPLTRPPRLKRGDLIAVATPSGAVHHPARLERGLLALRNLGFAVCCGPMASVQDLELRTPEARAEEFNGFLRDRKVRAIFATIGGHNSNAILDLVDWKALRSNPKVIVGYSDVTSLLLASIAEASVLTFHGPTVLPEFAEYPNLLGYTRDSFLQATSRPAPQGIIASPAEWTEEFLPWGKEDHRSRRMRPAGDWIWRGEGQCTGPLLGGNLETICRLAGTRYLPDFKDAVVLLETASTSPEAVEGSLAHLSMLGVFDSMAGLVVGRTYRGGDAFESQWNQYLISRFKDVGLPMVLGTHIGHTDPMLTLPLGARVSLNVAQRRLEVLDAAVC